MIRPIVPSSTIVHRMRPFVRHVAAGWKSWLVVFLVTVISSGFAVVQPWPMKVLVDNVLGDKPAPEWLDDIWKWLPSSDTAYGKLAWVALAGIGLFVANSVAEVTLTFAWLHAGQRLVYSLAADLFANLQRRSLIFHGQSSVGDLLGRVTTDSWCIYKIIDAALMAPTRALLLLGGMAALMWRADPMLTAVALVMLPLMVGSTLLFGRMIRAATRKRRGIESRLQTHVHQVLLGIPVVQAFANERREHLQFRRFADQVIDAQRRTAFLTSLSGLTSGLSTVAGSSVVVWVGASRVLDGQLTLGDLLIFLSYLGTLQAQFKIFTSIFSTLQEQAASLDRVLEVMSPEAEVPESPSAQSLDASHGNITIDGVTFGYVPGTPVLQDVCLQLHRGETLALVGPTGAGKTTLAALIPRLFDPWRGRVLIDGTDIRTVTVRSLREQVAIVLQDAFLLPGTVAENIALGRPSASREEIEAAAVMANADGFIRKLPQRYDSAIGQRGGTLSGGERQRLAIARAMLKNAPILILDEPTSALDADAESLLVEALDRLKQGKTTLIIAHRFSTIRRADRIVMLESGRIVEQGSHRELMAAQGRYHDFYLQHDRRHGARLRSQDVLGGQRA